MANTLAKSKLKRPVLKGVLVLEFFLATLVVVGTGLYLVFSLGLLFSDISNPQVFFSDLVKIFLSAIIGIEVARVLVTHNLFSMFDVLGLILIRKALSPETTVVEVLIVVIAFVILIVARRVTGGRKSSIGSTLASALDALSDTRQKE